MKVIISAIPREPSDHVTTRKSIHRTILVVDVYGVYNWPRLVSDLRNVLEENVESSFIPIREYITSRDTRRVIQHTYLVFLIIIEF